MAAAICNKYLPINLRTAPSMAQQQQAPMLQHTTDQFRDCPVDGTTAAAGAVSTSTRSLKIQCLSS